MRDKLEPQARNQYLSIIKEEADNLNTLVDDLFLLTKLKQPGFQINKKQVHLYTFVKKEIQKAAVAFSEANQRFVRHPDGSLCHSRRGPLFTSDLKFAEQRPPILRS